MQIFCEGFYIFLVLTTLWVQPSAHFADAQIEALEKLYDWLKAMSPGFSSYSLTPEVKHSATLCCVTSAVVGQGVFKYWFYS